MILTVADHPARPRPTENAGSVATVIAGSMRLSASIRAAVDGRGRRPPRRRGSTRPVNGGSTRTPAPASAVGEAARRLVLVHVVGIEPRGDHVADAGRRERSTIRGVDTVPFLSDAAGMADRMREDRAFGLGDRAPARISRRRLLRPARRGSGARRSPRPGSRPRSRPATARRCRGRSARGCAAIAASSTPSARSRSTRLACVFRLPSAPT